MRTFFAFFLTAVAVTWGAPAPKEKPAEEGPPTAEQTKASANNLRQIALSWHNFESANAKFPGDYVDKARKPLLSWRVAVLQYMGPDEAALFKEFKLDEAWDSEHNKKLIDKMPKIYVPVRKAGKAGQTYYLAIGGKSGILQPGGIPLAAITDGTSNTVMVAESAKPVTWTKPEDLDADTITPDHLGGMFEGDSNVAFADGFVRRFKKNINKTILKAMCTRAGGEVILDD